jgi:hypothetical protein
VLPLSVHSQWLGILAAGHFGKCSPGRAALIVAVHHAGTIIAGTPLITEPVLTSIL